MTSINPISSSQALLTLTLMRKYAQKLKADAQESTEFWLSLNLTYVRQYVVVFLVPTIAVVIFA